MRQIDWGKTAKSMIAVAGLYCFMSAAMADVVHLKNGKTLVGEITEETDIYLTIRLRTGEAKIEMSDVQSIEEKELPLRFFEVEKLGFEKEVEKSTPEKKETAEVLRQETKEDDKSKKKTSESEKGKQDKKEKAKKPQPPYNTSIEAKYSVENSSDIIDVKGTTGLPDKTLMYVFFKRLGSFIASREVPVKDNQFSVRFGPFEKQIAAGGYTVEADFIAYRQPEDVMKMIKEGQGGKKVESFNISYALTIEKQGKANLTEGQVKEKMLSLISELQGLYDELEEVHLAHKASYDKKAWDTWSYGWSLRLKKIKTRLYEISGNSFSLFPRAQDRIDNAIRNLSNLHSIYSAEVRDPVKFAELSKNPNAQAGPAVLTQVIRDSLKGAIAEVSSN